MFRRVLVAFCLMAMGSPLELHAQGPGRAPDIRRSGPRFGLTFLSAEALDSARAKANADVAPMLTQFGWQFEYQFPTTEGGVVALSDFVLLVGGMEQGLVVPSLTWLVGFRTPGDFELGVGPNVSPLGAALALSAGVTFRLGALAVPLNLAVVPSSAGIRTSILTGFNVYR